LRENQQEDRKTGRRQALLFLSSCLPVPLLSCAFACGIVLLGVGCGKTMTNDDCKRVGDHIRKVWDSEMEAAAPEKGPRSERASHTIKSEGDRVEAEWKSTCERELEGRKVDNQEVDCILGAKTVTDIQKCGTAKR